MSARVSSASAGFTLVETLVALAVTAMLATSGTMLMLQTLQGSEAVDERMASARKLIATNGLMRADFNLVTKRASRAADGYTLPLGFTGGTPRGDGELMRFVRAGWSDPTGAGARSDLQLVSYRLEDGALIRTAWLRPDPVPDTPRVERVMVEGIVDLDIRYRKAGKWETVWPGTVDGTHPDFVELVLSFSTDDQLTLAYSVGASG
jgi:general secretion pathway protein J